MADLIGDKSDAKPDEQVLPQKTLCDNVNVKRVSYLKDANLYHMIMFIESHQLSSTPITKFFAFPSLNKSAS